jgi:hypothetical protein
MARYASGQQHEAKEQAKAVAAASSSEIADLLPVGDRLKGPERRHGFTAQLINFHATRN